MPRRRLHKLKISLLAIVTLWSPVTQCHADRDIVFAARYYASPGSHATSHFHLYRINPDGTGKLPLTSGKHDDTNPQWSPDGKLISFTRDDNSLWVMPAGGGAVRKLISGDIRDIDSACWWPDSRALVIPAVSGGPESRRIDVRTGQIRPFPVCRGLDISPDGDMACLSTDTGYRTVNIEGDHVTPLAPLKDDISSPEWVGNQALMGIHFGDKGEAPCTIFSQVESGTVLSGRVFVPDHPDAADECRYIVAIPNDLRHILVACYGHIDRLDTDFYRTSVDTGAGVRLLADTQFVTFAPEGDHYLTAPARLIPYGRARGGHQRKVWMAELQVGKSASDPHPHSIVGGSVWVNSADWRKNPSEEKHVARSGEHE